MLEGRPHIVDLIKNGEIDLIVNTTEGKQAIRESFSIRREAVHHRVTYYTTVAAALRAPATRSITSTRSRCNRLQDLHQEAAVAHEAHPHDACAAPSAARRARSA